MPKGNELADLARSICPEGNFSQSHLEQASRGTMDQHHLDLIEIFGEFFFGGGESIFLKKKNKKKVWKIFLQVPITGMEEKYWR